MGLRAPHYRDALETPHAIPWFEVHSENFFGAGGRPLQVLEQVRNRFPLSLHGVGLGLGSADRLDPQHLASLNALVRRFDPVLVSEHLGWGAVSGCHVNDLLPLPYTEEALQHVCRRVGELQDALGRQVLLENVSSYLEFKSSTLSEWDFVAEVARRSGCGILLDLSNVHVNAVNHGYDPQRYLDAIPVAAVGEIHLAGFTDTGELLIDTHGAPVPDPVWDLYARALQRFGPVPVLVEWDTDIPAFGVLAAEAHKAQAMLEAARAKP